MIRIIRFSFFISLILLVSACATKKKKGDIGWFGKVYQNTTARYNGYYNATVLMDETKLQLNDQYSENYNQFLELYPMVKVDNPSTVSANLDKAIEKVTTVANLHEPSHWVDDCYVLMGEAQYLKQDYETAEETMEYFTTEFDPGIPAALKSKSKEAEKTAADQRREELKKERDQRAKEQEREKEFKAQKSNYTKQKRDISQKSKETKLELRDEKRSLDQSHKKEDQSFKERERDLEAKHKNELQKLKESHRNNARKRREAESKRQKEEREELKKQREKAAKETSRSTRRKKTDPKTENQANTNAQNTAVDPETLAKKKEDAEIKALEKKHQMETAQLAEQRTKMENKWSSETKQYENKVELNQKHWEQELANIEQNENQFVSNKEQQDLRLQQELERQRELEETKPVAKTKKPEKLNTGQGGGLFKHKPVFHEGQLLLAKIYIERQNWSSADYLLRKLQSNPGISKSVAKELPVVRAYLNIQQKKYEEAIPALEQAISLEGKNSKKARYAYVLAQIHQRQGSSSKAYDAFEMAGNMAKNYELKFNAKLSQARNSWNSSNSSSESIMKMLDKMMDDGKNKEYLDQIYFTRAEINLASGNETLAFEDFSKALSSSAGNNIQKAESYYRLADIHYEKEDYGKAKLYYDSTAQVMQKTDERLDVVNQRSQNLAGIAQNIGIIETQDSLLRLGNLPKSELLTWAKERIENEEKAAEKANETLNQGIGAITTPADRFQTGGSNKSSFFAYNPLSLQKGKLDFSRKWGTRKLEDDWRRSSKSSSIIEEDLAIEESEQEFEETSDAALNALISQIPTDPEKKESAHRQLGSSLYELGTLFRIKLQKLDKSNKALLRLVNDYPNSELVVDACYYLYLNFRDLGNEIQSTTYLNRILNEFSDSEYAKILGDPDYLAKLEAKKNKEENYYNETYAQFLAGSYDVAATRISEAPSLFPQNKYLAKYDLLQAMISGNKEGSATYIKSLKDFIVRHPNTDEQTRAKEILRFLQGDENAFDARLYEESLEEFQIENDKLHYVILVTYDATEKMINDAKIKLARYHNTYHKLDKLRVSNIYLNPSVKSQVILVRRFDNKTKAMSYLNAVEKNKKEYVDPSIFSYDLFAVTQRNYREIMKQRNANNYKLFFEQYYK